MQLKSKFTQRRQNTSIRTNHCIIQQPDCHQDLCRHYHVAWENTDPFRVQILIKCRNTDKIRLNGWFFAYQLSGCGFKSLKIQISRTSWFSATDWNIIFSVKRKSEKILCFLQFPIYFVTNQEGKILIRNWSNDKILYHADERYRIALTVIILL